MTGVIFQKDKEISRNTYVTGRGVSTELKARHTNVKRIIIIISAILLSTHHNTYPALLSWMNI